MSVGVRRGQRVSERNIIRPTSSSLTSLSTCLSVFENIVTFWWFYMIRSGARRGDGGEMKLYYTGCI